MVKARLQEIFILRWDFLFFSPLCTIPGRPIAAGFVALSEGLKLPIIDHHSLERLNLQPERRVVQQQGRVDVQLDAGCKAHLRPDALFLLLQRKHREARADVDFLLALLGLFDDVELAAG